MATPRGCSGQHWTPLSSSSLLSAASCWHALCWFPLYVPMPRLDCSLGLVSLRLMLLDDNPSRLTFFLSDYSVCLHSCRYCNCILIYFIRPLHLIFTQIKVPFIQLISLYFMRSINDWLTCQLPYMKTVVLTWYTGHHDVHRILLVVINVSIKFRFALTKANAPGNFGNISSTCPFLRANFFLQEPLYLSM